jgi:hypothetical protein
MNNVYQDLGTSILASLKPITFFFNVTNLYPMKNDPVKFAQHVCIEAYDLSIKHVCKIRNKILILVWKINLGWCNFDPNIVS